MKIRPIAKPTILAWFLSWIAAACFVVVRLEAQPALAQKGEKLMWSAAEDYYTSRGEFSRARTVLVNLREYLDETGQTDAKAYVNATGRLARLLANTGDTDGAVRLLNDLETACARQFGPEAIEVARVKSSRAQALFNAKRYEDAERDARSALELLEHTLKPEHPQIGVTSGMLAAVLHELGRFDEAQPLFERCHAIMRENYGDDHAATTLSRFNLGTFYLARGKVAEAKEAFSRSEVLLTPGKASANDRQYYNTYAALGLVSGDRQLALDNAQRLFDAETVVIKDLFPQMAEEERLQAKQQLSPTSWFATLNDRERVAHAVLQTKAITLDALGGSNAEQGTDPFAHLLRRENTAEAMKPVPAELLAGMSLGQKNSVPTPVDLRSPLYALKPEQVCAALPGDAAVVEFVRYEHHLNASDSDSRYGALIFRPAVAGSDQTAYTWVPLGAAAPIDAEIGTLLVTAEDRVGAVRAGTILRSLHRQIWAPVADALPRGTKHVFIGPDGSLCFVPFAALIGPNDRFVAESMMVSYVSSTRDLLQKRGSTASADPALVIFAAPDFGLPQDAGELVAASFRDVEVRSLAELRLLDLPGARREAEMLAEIARRYELRPVVFQDAEAAEPAVRALRAPHILHFATHAFVLEPSAAAVPPHPMDRSGLALAGAQRTIDALANGEKVPARDSDGLLTAREVMELPLAGTWLVTLAACDSGQGEVRDGESVLGLRRGFLAAGVQNLLLSLWMVADQHSADFMADFYARALESGDAATALAVVQRDWLVKLRKERGISAALTLAGPFVLNCSGRFSLVPGNP